VIVTTHYERLKTMAATDARFVNASVGFDLERLAPTFELHLGVPGGSGAIPVARRLGLPEAIARRAELLLGQGARGIEELLQQVERERRRMADAARGAEAEREVARAERERAEELASATEERLRAARRAEHDAGLDALKRARMDIEQARAQLKREASRGAVEQAERRVDEAAARLKRSAPPTEQPPGRPATEEELVVGAEVLVPRLGGRGVVTAAAKAGKVAVQIGALKLTVDAGELRVPSRGAEARRAHEPGERAAGRGTPRAREAVRTPANSVDVRGERVDAAIAVVEKFLDEALRTGGDAVFVVHGHGTGALRAALREHLATVPGVASVRAGTPEEGGDGVTVVALA